MSPGFAIAQAGQSMANQTHGEPLDYYSGDNKLATVTATVDRDANKGRDFWLKPGEVDFELRGISEIEISKSVLPAAPVAGNFFADAFSTNHRIRYVTQTDVSWQCVCYMSLQTQS